MMRLRVEVIGPLMLEMVVGEEELVLHGGGQCLSGLEQPKYLMEFVHPESFQ